jgi:hypothetical protein
MSYTKRQCYKCYADYEYDGASLDVCPRCRENKVLQYDGGLTKRELFAALAMQGYVAAGKTHRFDDLAADSLKAADQLIKTLADIEPPG